MRLFKLLSHFFHEKCSKEASLYASTKLEKVSQSDMKKRTAVIGALVSLLPLGQPLFIGTGAVLTSAAVMIAVPEKAKAESAFFL